MSHRFRRSKSGLHVHCESCYSRRCRTRVEVSVSCAVIPCRLLCGAVFHLCKEEEHLLLCPNVRVPCLNADYGCTLTMTRSCRGAHLQTCPASVVCCSMDWLRWPVDTTSPHHNIGLQENVLMKSDGGQGDVLDVAMALVDQDDLYGRLMMKPLYPELMEEEEEEEEEDKKEGEEQEEKATGDDGGSPASCSPGNGAGGEPAENNPGQQSGVHINVATHKLMEMMFSMEKRCCEVAQANHDSRQQKTNAEEKTRSPGRENSNKDGGKSTAEGKRATSDEKEAGTGESAAAISSPLPDTNKTGLAPWQDGVLERLGQEVSPQEFNMYLVHHGRMLLRFGQIDACTPRERDFVYGSLEPIPVQTLRSFKVPDSYHHKRRVHLYDTTARVKSETRSVDTSDLGFGEEDWNSDEAEATLLGYAEIEVMGHKISESKGTDGLYVEEGTQTHSFRTAPFKRTTTLAELMVDRPRKLYLQLQAESITSRHNKSSSVFTFLCGHTFLRREFPTHFRNVHGDIQTCLSGWFEHRCPLAYLGCTYSQKRFQPSTHEATITYNQKLRSFNLRPALHVSLEEASMLPRSSTEKRGWIRGDRGRGGEKSLSALPYEVLCHVASFLDSLSLSQLALVSHLMRDVCSSLLQERGMVTLRWERETYSHGRAKWKAKKVWEFSKLFSTVDSWKFVDVPSMSSHLKVCPYYERSLHSGPVPLQGMKDQQRLQRDMQSLVHQFMGNRSKH